MGFSAETVTGQTPAGERARIIADFKAGRIRCLTNANVLTTGFDAPATDLIAFLRPTLSTGLYVQMAGRGTRLADGKDNCLILDFAGNVRRHGPVDTIEVKGRSGGEGEREASAKVDDVRAKTCPACEALVGLRELTCQYCGHEFPPPAPKIEREADATVPILSTERLRPVEVGVVTWAARRHQKPDGIDSIRVDYFAGIQVVPEWICPEHSGFARSKFERWWRRHHGAEPVPASVDETLKRWPELAMPAAIQTRVNGKWTEVVGRRVPDIQERASA